MGTLNTGSMVQLMNNGWNDVQAQFELDVSTDEGAQSYSPALGIAIDPNDSTQVIDGPNPLWTVSIDGETLTTLTIRVDPTNSGAFSKLGDWDNGGTLSESVDKGAEITADLYGISFATAGLAELAKDGDDDVAVNYEILNGSGTVLATKDETDAAFTFEDNAGLEGLAKADIEFSNGSGGSWNVEEFRVITQGGQNVVFSDTSISTTVADGSSITFTTAKVDLSLP